MKGWLIGAIVTLGATVSCGTYGDVSPGTEATVEPSTAVATAPAATAIPSPTAASTPTWQPTPTPTLAPTPTPTPEPTPIGPGTASLTYSGVLSGTLLDAVSYCYPRPDLESEITVNGTLDGTPWVLFIDSYDGQSGVWQVLTGEAGGATGLTGQGYGVDATYPATVSGVTQIDWTAGATFDVELESRAGQTPPGDVEVTGTVACG